MNNERDNKKELEYLEKISNNISFFFWLTIISLTASVVVVVVNKTNLI